MVRIRKQHRKTNAQYGKNTEVFVTASGHCFSIGSLRQERSSLVQLPEYDLLNSISHQTQSKGPTKWLKNDFFK